MWIEYDTDKPTMQWECQDTKVIIQSYGKDERYPAFKAKLDSGEIVPVKWEDSDQYADAIAAQEAAMAEMIPE